MPLTELASSSEARKDARTIGTSLLKKHKILPRPQDDRTLPPLDITPLESDTSHDMDLDAGFSYIAASDSSSPRVLKHASKRIGDLPPTPPTHSRQSSGNHGSISSRPRQDSATLRTSTREQAAPRTPPDQRSPPTPDVTPPMSRQPFTYHPSLQDGYLPTDSSRAQSFKTAQESLDSEDDEIVTVRPGLISTGSSRTSVPRVSSTFKHGKEVGLGLGLPSRSDNSTTPRQERQSEREFVIFDGEWVDNSDAVEVEREWDSNLGRNVTVRKRLGRNMALHVVPPQTEVLESNIISPTSATRFARSLPLQERIAKHRQEREAANRRSIEKFANQISWPQSVADPESPIKTDVRRLSSVSTRSQGSTAIVEAMLIEATPARPKTLRKTRKLSGLRDLSGTSYASSTCIESPSHELPPRERLSDRDRYSTTASTVSNTGTVKSRRQIEKSGAIPVAVIPARRSSTRSSGDPSLKSTESRKSKKANSTTSAPLSASSKYNDPAYIDSLHSRGRSVSDSASSRSVRTIDFPPEIPARSSSLSAPTSRNTSRAPSIAPETPILEATSPKVVVPEVVEPDAIVPESKNGSRSASLTAASLKAHDLREARKASQPDVVSNDYFQVTPRLTQHGQLRLDHNGEPLGSRRSTQPTPFSQYSYETAVTMPELSEAQAMEIFPHQNTSVVVVQHQNSSPGSSPTSQDPPTPTAPPPAMALNGNITQDPSTPPQPKHHKDEVDSPLRNPRKPPSPPVITFIPPTPAGMTPGHEEERQLGYDPEERVRAANNTKHGASIVRRAFSNTRRNSDAQVPAVGFLRRTFSLSHNRKIDDSFPTSKNENDAPFYPNEDVSPSEEHKLHPYWRPTYVWDDAQDGELEYFSPRYPIIDNRPKHKRALSEKLKRTFAILPLQEDTTKPIEAPKVDRLALRRSPSGNNLRVVKRRSGAPALTRETSYSQRPVSDIFDAKPTTTSTTFGHGFKEGNRGHNRSVTLPGLGLKVEYVGWDGLKRKFVDRKREQRTQALRASIGPPSAVRSGVDDVLRKNQSQSLGQGIRV